MKKVKLGIILLVILIIIIAISGIVNASYKDTDSDYSGVDSYGAYKNEERNTVYKNKICLFGYVKDADGKPVATKDVKFFNGLGNQIGEKTTNENGFYTIDEGDGINLGNIAKINYDINGTAEATITEYDEFKYNDNTKIEVCFI